MKKERYVACFQNESQLMIDQMKTWVTAAMLVFVTAVETASRWATRFDQGFLQTGGGHHDDGVS